MNIFFCLIHCCTLFALYCVYVSYMKIFVGCFVVYYIYIIDILSCSPFRCCAIVFTTIGLLAYFRCVEIILNESN